MSLTFLCVLAISELSYSKEELFLYNELSNKLRASDISILWIVYAVVSAKSSGAFPTSYALDELQIPSAVTHCCLKGI